MDIDDVFVCLAEIDISNIYRTKHFDERADYRKDHIHQDTNIVESKILNEKPVSISKQDDYKFKLIYELDEKYDLTIIISIKDQKPFAINLVTFFKVDIAKRVH